MRLGLFSFGKVQLDRPIRLIYNFIDAYDILQESLWPTPIAERLGFLNGVDDGPQLYYYLTSQFGLELYEDCLRWCVESKNC